MTNDPKTVLVSEAARGLGGDVALGLARAGWFVAVPCDGAAGEAKGLVDLIASEGGRATMVPLERTDEGQGRRLIGKAVAAVGPLDCLIISGPAFDPAVLIAEFAEEFSGGAGGGREGNIISLLETPHPAFDPLAPSLILSLAPRVRINAIRPGPVVGRGNPAGEADFEQWSSFPFGFKVQIGKIVSTVLFILDTPSMTGQMIALGDGRQ